MTPEEGRIRELVRLLERDYDQTSEFIRSVVGTASTTRGWAVTVWLALLGVAVQQERPALALLAGATIVPFALLDAYHSWLYGQALRHARGIEDLSASYYRAVERGEDDEDLMFDFQVAIAAHRFGLYSQFRRFSVPELRAARPKLVFQWFYPGLFIAAIVTAVLIAVLSDHVARAVAPSPRSLVPSIRLFALDEVIPSHGTSCYQSAGQVRETVSATMTARLPRQPLLLRRRGLVLDPHQRVSLIVHPPGSSSTSCRSAPRSSSMLSLRRGPAVRCIRLYTLYLRRQ